MKVSQVIRRLNCLSVAEPKTAFSSTRASFTPRFSFDEKVESDLEAWGDISKYGLCLVHALGISSFGGELFQRRAQDVLRGWDVISTSMIARNRIRRQAQAHNLPNRILRQIDSCNCLYANLGLILKVPPQNILGTHEYDVFFPTHAPAAHYEFASRILARRTAKGKLFNEDLFTKIESPAEILKKTITPSAVYNEILVVTRPNVRVHFSATEEVRVQGIIYSQHGNAFIRDKRRDQFMLDRLCQVNPDLAVEYI
ncbi:Uncharacterised protein [Pseudomonas putida]|uniref:hypothetical protein n=1 Tax=Pseudomonas TaxID=286 RepID=UPI0018D7A86B|nr:MULTISPECIES: hypothetical protein [Pseudomonas]CAB5574742.1 Uncharacterised protein [Pseudomonas putida]MBH3359919.1 hypothetical protein [Pseudomonas guariconensis]MCO7622385.1 hypothetical protein [Pseudomonas guariconensis]MDM9595359.1 hypothetical protein [Pseudomonas guariconensis]MDM9608189.1 hypothetical protein [Pseudomonas guariconensis]